MTIGNITNLNKPDSQSPTSEEENAEEIIGSVLTPDGHGATGDVAERRSIEESANWSRR